MGLWLAVALLMCRPVWASRLVVLVPQSAEAGAAASAAARVGELLRDESRYELVGVEHALEPSSKAQAELAKAHEALTEGAAKLQALLADEAQERLRAAVAGFRSHPAHLDAVGPVAEALLHLAALDLLTQDTRSATRRINDALALQPGIKPDPRVWNPPMLARFKQAADGRASVARGKLALDSAVAGAAVYVDGAYRGQTPFEAELPVGEHFVRVTRQGWAPWGKVVEVKGGTARLKAAPQPLKRRSELDRALAAALVPGPEQGSAVRALGELVRADLLLLAEPAAAQGELRVRFTLFSAALGLALRRHEHAVSVGGEAAAASAAARALQPPRFALVAVGCDPGPGDPAPVATSKAALVAALARLGASATFVGEGRLEPACLASGECLARALGVRPDGVLQARVTATSSSGVEVSVELTSLHDGGRVFAEQVRRASAEGLTSASLARPLARGLGALWESVEKARGLGARLTADGSAAMAAEAVAGAEGPATGLTAATGAVSASPELLSYGLLGGGAVLALVGLLVSSSRAGVLDDATSSGADKESARRVGRLGIAMTGLGVVAGALGGVFLWRSEEPAP